MCLKQAVTPVLQGADTLSRMGPLGGHCEDKQSPDDVLRATVLRADGSMRRIEAEMPLLYCAEILILKTCEAFRGTIS